VEARKGVILNFTDEDRGMIYTGLGTFRYRVRSVVEALAGV
jgi:hypothetical protein